MSTASSAVSPARRLRPRADAADERGLALGCGLLLDLLAEVLGELADVLRQRRLRIDRDVGDDLRAQRLGQLDGSPQTAVGGRLASERGVLDVLGPEPEDHVLAFVGAQGGPRAEGFSVERETLVAELDRQAPVVASEAGLEHVHGRAADEAADEEVDGPVVQSPAAAPPAGARPSA